MPQYPEIERTLRADLEASEKGYEVARAKFASALKELSAPAGNHIDVDFQSAATERLEAAQRYINSLRNLERQLGRYRIDGDPPKSTSHFPTTS